jgi:inner membrane protein
MDTVTHMLLGAATAPLGFRSRIGRDATWMAAAAALIPDLDIFILPWVGLGGSENPAVAHVFSHRGLTHSLLVVPLVAAVVAGAWWAGRRLWLRRRAQRQESATAAMAPPAPFWMLYACALLAALTHPLLDWCTSYGTELFAPITDTRYACDAVGIIDLFFTGILVATFLACFLIRKIGRVRWERAALAVGWIGFLAAVGYLGAGRAMHDRAVAEIRGMVAPERVLRAEAYPALGTIFLWRGVAETEDAFVVARLRPLSGEDRPPERASKATGPLVERARELPQVRNYIWFAMGLVEARFNPKEGPDIVEFHDMRYGPTTDSVESLWPLRVTFDDAGNVVDVRRVSPVGPGTSGRWSLIRRMWHDLWGR